MSRRSDSIAVSHVTTSRRDTLYRCANEADKIRHDLRLFAPPLKAHGVDVCADCEGDFACNL